MSSRLEVAWLTAIGGGFHSKRDNGESVPCVQKDRYNLGRIPKEISVYSPFGLGNHPRSSYLSTFLELLRHLFHTRCAVFLMPQNRVRRGAGILSRIASRHAATIATNCSIGPHEFITSKFPLFCSLYILPFFRQKFRKYPGPPPRPQRNFHNKYNYSSPLLAKRDLDAIQAR